MAAPHLQITLTLKTPAAAVPTGSAYSGRRQSERGKRWGAWGADFRGKPFQADEQSNRK